MCQYKIQKNSIVFVRHAMSIDNEAWLEGLPWPGVKDAPLCKEGLDSLARISLAVAKLGPSIIFSSPLSRALDTAKAISEASQARIFVDSALTEEFHTDGDLPLPTKQLQLKYANTDIVFKSFLQNASSNFVGNEAMFFLANIALLKNHKVCIVGHRGWFKNISNMEVNNGEIIQLEITVFLDAVLLPKTVHLVSANITSYKAILQ